MSNTRTGLYFGFEPDPRVRGVLFDPPPTPRLRSRCPAGCDIEYGADGPDVEQVCPHMQITRRTYLRAIRTA